MSTENKKVDNNRYYNSSLAYDFDLFMPHDRPEKTANTKNVIKSNIKKKEKHKKQGLITSLCVFVFLGVIFYSLYLRTQGNEINNNINVVKKEITLLSSEEVSLKCKLERMVSYKNLELEAAKMGMVKPSKNQITYIKIHNENACIIGEGE